MLEIKNQNGKSFSIKIPPKKWSVKLFLFASQFVALNTPTEIVAGQAPNMLKLWKIQEDEPRFSIKKTILPNSHYNLNICTFPVVFPMHFLSIDLVPW